MNSKPMRSAGLLLLVLAGCARPVELAKQTFVVELGSDVYANPSLYVKDAADEEVTGMEIISASPGVQKTDNRFISSGQEYLVSGEYDFILKNGAEEIPFVIKVKDTLPPSTKNQVESAETTLGVMPDWASLFEAADLSGVSYDAPASAVENRGESDVEVTISDRFGNSTVRTVHLTVR